MVGIKFHFEPLVTGSHLGILARHGKIVMVIAARRQFHHAEGASDQIRAAPARQRLDQLFIIDAKNFDVEIPSMRQFQQRIAHRAAHQVSAAQFRRLQQDLFQFWWNEIHRDKLRSSSGPRTKNFIGLEWLRSKRPVRL